ncbi:MAG: class I SAM-dependent methyltransferase [Thermoleophilia bacterium]
MLDYLDVLAEMHATRRPRTYLEIGVSHGDSLRLAYEGTLCIGVDPEPNVPQDLTSRCHIESMTSDDFFASPRLPELLGDKTLDVAFIDGLHLFEFALRDFMNIEAHSREDSLIILHDCLPRDAETSSRERTTVHWTGDVWKLTLCLLEHRPDLEISLIDVPPSGLLFIRKPRPGDLTLRDNYAAIVEQFVPLGFEEWSRRKTDVMHRLTNTSEAKMWDVRHKIALAHERIAQRDARVTELERQLRDVHDSTSWRFTAPVRWVGQVLGKGRKAQGRP